MRVSKGMVGDKKGREMDRGQQRQGKGCVGKKRREGIVESRAHSSFNHQF